MLMHEKRRVTHRIDVHHVLGPHRRHHPSILLLLIFLLPVRQTTLHVDLAYTLEGPEALTARDAAGLLPIEVEKGEAGTGVGFGADRGRRGVDARDGTEGVAVEDVDRERKGQLPQPAVGVVYVGEYLLPYPPAGCNPEPVVLVVRGAPKEAGEEVNGGRLCRG